MGFRGATMNFAKWIFRLSAIIGSITLIPFLFLEDVIAKAYPPGISHPEHYYAFLLLALCFQVLFLIISFDPVRYRMMIIPAILEKFSYVLCLATLFAKDRLGFETLVAASPDLIWGILFIAAYLKLRGQAHGH